MAILRFPLLAIVILLCLSPASKADPASTKGTLYLKDADSYIGKATIIPKISSNATIAPTPSPIPTPTATPAPNRLLSDDDDVKPLREYPPAIIHSSAMTVGSQIPVPTQYAAPQVAGSLNGGVTVVPATPTTFQTIQTGVTLGTDGSGVTTLRDTELSGVVNYGQPIRTVVPVFNSQGQRIGSQVITVSSNPIIVPVTTTIQISQ